MRVEWLVHLVSLIIEPLTVPIQDKATAIDIKIPDGPPSTLWINDCKGKDLFDYYDYNRISFDVNLHL